MCNTNFDSELIFYACVPTKKIMFFFMFYEIRTKLKKKPVTAVLMKISLIETNFLVLLNKKPSVPLAVYKLSCMKR